MFALQWLIQILQKQGQLRLTKQQTISDLRNIYVSYAYNSLRSLKIDFSLDYSDIIYMSSSRPPIDSNPIVRYLHLHTLLFVFNLFFQNPKEPTIFPFPRMELFRRIPDYYTDLKDRYKLFKNLLLCYRWQISVGVLLAVIYASLNLLLSQIIKEFMQTMQAQEGRRTSSSVALKFIMLQLLRLVFRAHMKRTFEEVAIQVESALAQRLVHKALVMDQEQRKRIPETQIFQLENVDLRLIYNLFKILYLAVEIPFTIGVAIIWLFLLNPYLGFIAMYWFAVIFLVQRVLDDQMHHCNITKLRLIDERSKLNYEFMEKIPQARIIRAESLMVECNNDYFLQENHDHLLFYRYASLYDIAQLLLPIAVVVTASVLDQNRKDPLTVQQLYLILSLLGICYRPMKDFRTLSISLNDGFHSLRRITDYLQLREEQPRSGEYHRTPFKPASISIAKGTSGLVKGNGSSFEMSIKFHLQMKAGERHVVLGRKGQGSSTFLNMLMGQVSLVKGRIDAQGKIGYLSGENFLLIDSLRSNLVFFNKTISEEKLVQVFKELGLNDQLRLSKGLQEIIEENKFNEHQLKLISLGRVFCSEADIYVLDCPFSGLNIDAASKVEKMLRKKQEEGVLIVMTEQKTSNIHDDDRVIVLNVGVTAQVGTFRELCGKSNSSIEHFLKKQPIADSNQREKQIRKVALQFQIKVRKALMYRALFEKESAERERRRKVDRVIKCVGDYSANLAKQSLKKKLKEAEERQKASVSAYFWKFIRSFPFSESLYILFIIISVEVLHIFIHFYIGHEYQHRAKEGVKAIRTLMFYQGILTLGLAGLIYLQGEVSSHLAIIAGNRLYKQSLEALVHKELRWYGQEYSLRTANKFNHDYEQIFIVVHAVLTLYKNAIILIATALFVGGSHPLILLITVIVGVIYSGIFFILRKVHSCILKHHSDYKYEFVKVFNESVQGASFIKIYEVTNQVIQKGKEKYLKLASYKLAVSYVARGQSLLCDLASTFITAAALDYGTDIRLVKKTDIAVIATSILLLLNLADVLKAILDAAIEVQTFFRLNILPFMQMAPLELHQFKQIYPAPPAEFGIYIESVLFKQQEEAVFEIYPLKLRIEEGERVCIYEQDQNLRDNLLYGLTKNLNVLSRPTATHRTVFIGGLPICQYSSRSIHALIGVIMNENFFFTGTLKQNLKWRAPNFDEERVMKLAEELELGNTLKGFKEFGLQTRVEETDEEFSEVLSKKLAVLRIIIRCPKIVIIKDTVPFVDKWSIVDLLDKYNPGCTIIKITNTLEVAYDMKRIVYMEHLKVVEDGSLVQFKNDRLSKTGEMLRNCNTEGYVYRNRVSGYRKRRGSISGSKGSGKMDISRLK